MKLTWDDLIIDFTDLDVLDLYKSWNWLLNGQFRPLLMSTFGDLFYQRPDNKVYYLDTIEGRVVLVAENEKDFHDFINKTGNRENYLLSYLVFELKEKGLNLGKNQCYTFKIAPILGGKIELNNIEMMDLKIWAYLTGQIHKQVIKPVAK